VQAVRRRNLLGRIRQRLQLLPARKLRHHRTDFLSDMHSRPLLLDG
jgi:hypothetical protein